MGYRLLADGQWRSGDTWATGLNNNDAVIGPPGSGKTRGYVLPNILQGSESMLIADTKGMLKGQTAAALERSGYRVLELDLTDCQASNIGYNPLRCIRYHEGTGRCDEQDILTAAACLVPIEIINEPFWDRAARMLLEALIGYVLEVLPRQEHTLTSVALLLTELGGSAADRLLDEYAVLAPESFTALRWKLYRSMAPADRTCACVQGILAEKLSALLFDGPADLFTRQNQLDFAAMGRERTALFLTVSDTDRALDPLAALLYTQAIHTLCRAADRSAGHRLDIPVRLYLDDFAANVTIPDFDRMIATIRSREISVSVILQSLSQLEALYGHARALTILNCCDSMLYLGGQDIETARYIGVKANRPTSAVLNMPLDGAWLFTRGEEPRQVRKYDLRQHPRYGELPEAGPVLDDIELDLPF